MPFQGPYQSVSILQDKSKFRQFLTENGFNVPNAKGYTCLEDALKNVDFFNWPVIVKPVDSAGSKGVSRVDNPDNLAKAVEYALSEAHNGHFIIEDFLEKERFDVKATNPYTPSAYSWPSTIPTWAQDELQSELQRLMTLLDMKTGIYNVETRLCTNGKPYIMEVSPRGGGNRLAEMLNYSTRTKLVECAVKAAMGETIDDLNAPHYYGHLAEVILHADKAGIFKQIDIAEDKQERVVETDLWVSPGDKVESFDGANHAIGTLVVRFNTLEELEDAMSNIESWCKVIVES